MSDREALHQFLRRPVSHDMVQYLAATTESIISVREDKTAYPSPPGSPGRKEVPVPTLESFIRRLIEHSNVQTPTLMSSLVYLTKLRAIIPPHVYGIPTTRHRIFLGCLILAAKSLNDSSPLNKHWCKYTDGLLTIQEINTIERELLEYFKWELRVTNETLFVVLAPFLAPIKLQILKKQEEEMLWRSQSSLSIPSVMSNYSVATAATSMSSMPSLRSVKSSGRLTNTPGQKKSFMSGWNKIPVMANVAGLV